MFSREFVRGSGVLVVSLVYRRRSSCSGIGVAVSVVEGCLFDRVVVFAECSASGERCGGVWVVGISIEV